MHRPVCVGCETEYKPIKNGVVVADISQGVADQLTFGDEFECPKCESRIVVGFGQKAYIDFSDDGFTEELAMQFNLGLVRKNLR